MKRQYYTDLAFKVIITLLMAVFIAGIISALCSCRTKKETQSERIADVSQEVASRADTLIVWKERTDSVVVRDSVFTLIKGDTVFIKEYHYRDRAQKIDAAAYQASKDTVWKERTVTEYRTKIETVEVERKLAWWQKALMWSGAAALLALLVMFVRKFR